jgi:excisionase family DNA binding protein
MERLLSRQELAELLGVPAHTLDAWAMSGTGPRYSVIGRHARYRPADVEKWLESRARTEAAAR